MKIALIEIGGAHDECLYSQIRIIKSVPDIHLTLICDKALLENTKRFDQVDKKIFVSIRKGVEQWVDLFRLWKFIKTEKFDKLIFNTAQGKLVSRLARFPFLKHSMSYGILHDIRKLNSSHSQKSISKRVAHYFVLSDYLKNKIDNSASISSFYPIFFPEYPSQQVHKEKDEIWICVPGQVELKRRDYNTLFESIKEHGVHKNIKFLLLGRCEHKHGDGAFVKQKISDLLVTDNFLVWDDFIPVTEFYSMIKNSDYILPLIHEGDISANLYETQISGSYNLAVAFNKPILSEESIKILFEYNPITYKKNSLMNTINQLEQYDANNFYSENKWTFDFQRKKYLESLGIVGDDN